LCIYCEFLELTSIKIYFSSSTQYIWIKSTVKS